MQRTRLSRSQTKSFVKSRRDRRIWAVGLVIVVLLAWVFVFSRLSGLNAFEITNVQIYGADPDIVSTLRAAAQSELNGSYLGLFDRANAALYPKSQIAAAVMAASARIDAVDIHHTGIHGLSITVGERAPSAIVCAELPDFTSDPESDSDCYFADSDGLIFQSASTSASAISNRYYDPDLANGDIIGSYSTSTDEFARLQSFSDGARAAGLATYGILVKDGGEYELYAANPASTTEAVPDVAVIYFNDAGSLPSELSDLTSFWDKEMSDGRASGNPPRFESIDVRYGSNVFYRLEK